MKSIIIIGGDKRQSELNKILTEQGMRCRHICTRNEAEKELKIRKQDILIFPVPVSRDKETVYSSESNLKIKLKDVLNAADRTNLVFGGGFSDTVRMYMKDKGIDYTDYTDNDEFLIYNAYLTGLGALKLLYEISGEDISGKRVLITGFGRVARFTALELKKAGCDVYICARNSLQLTEAQCLGYKIISFDKMKSFLYLFDYIFNTVPANIFSDEDVSHIKGRYFELASYPFGAERECFAAREENYIFAGALPGRYLYRSAAEKIAEITISRINSRNGGD